MTKREKECNREPEPSREREKKISSEEYATPTVFARGFRLFYCYIYAFSASNVLRAVSPTRFPNGLLCSHCP